MRAIIAALAALGGGVLVAAFGVFAATGDGSEAGWAVRADPGLRGVRSVRVHIPVDRERTDA